MPGMRLRTPGDGGRVPRATALAGLVASGLAFFAAPPARADDLPPEMLRQLNELTVRAERALKEQGPEAAIRIYEEGMLGPLGELGRISLRLGQLYHELGRNAEAAHHFRACQADTRVDAIDRELICQQGFQAVTAPLEIEDLPPRARVVVLEPTLFAGPFENGGRLPIGRVRLVVEAPGREQAVSDVEVQPPATKWRAILGPPLEDGRPRHIDIPSDFIADEPPPVPESTGGGVGRWPAYVVGGVGLGLVGGGLYLGLDSSGTLDDVRGRQARGACGPDRCRGDLEDAGDRALLADGLWIGGAVLTVAAGVLWYVLDDEPAPVEAAAMDEATP